MGHTNLQVDCPGCEKIILRYSGFSPVLEQWFSDLRVHNPDCHVSCAGRGRVDQEACFARGASKAHYGQSAHNVNGALDIWEMRDGVYTLDQQWFDRVVGPAIVTGLEWYGAPGAAFPELPHVQLADWRKLYADGVLSLVE
jgi:hypothetical protein